MGCLLSLFCRLVFLFVLVSTDWIGRAFDSMVWPLLGFIFLPCTTLTYVMIAMNGNEFSIGTILLMTVALVVDFAQIGGDDR